MKKTGAIQDTGITAGEKYIIKVVAKNEVGEAISIVEVFNRSTNIGRYSR